MMEVKNLKLILAAHEGRLEDINKLLIEGADINCQDVQGRTPLHYAAAEDHKEVVKHLLLNGAEFIEDKDSKTPFDLISPYSRQELLPSFSKNILKISHTILAPYKVPERNPNHTYSGSDCYKYSDSGFEFFKSVEALSKRFKSTTINNKVSHYERGNAIILALEFFSVVSDTTMKKILDITHADVNQMINLYYIDLEKNADYLFAMMKKWIGNLQSFISNDSIFICNQDLFSISKVASTFLSGLHRNAETMDPMDKLKNLVFETYSENDKEHLEQQWFEFIVNIYPSLKIEDKSSEDLSEMETQIKGLKNNLLYEFHHFGIEEFLDAIKKLRSRLFEFYYCKNVTESLMLLTPETDSKEIIQILNSELDLVSGDLGLHEDELLIESEVEGIKLVDVKFIENLYPKILLKNQNATLAELVQEYFRFMPLLEDLNLDTTTLCQELRFESGCEYTQENTKKVYEFVSDVEKKNLFEKFIKLKMIKEHCSGEVYEVEKRLFEQELCNNYNVSQAKFRQVCKYYLEDDENFNEEIQRIIDNTILFIRKLSAIKETEKSCSGMQIDYLGEIILQNNENKIFSSSECNTFRNKLASKNQNNHIKQAFYLSDFFNVMDIPVGNIIFEVDIKKTVIHMLKTFYNAFNEYKIELDIEKIFVRETFLNELVRQISETIRCFKATLGENYGILNSHIFMIIQKLLKIEFLSPLVVKILEVLTKEQIFSSPSIDADHLFMLIDILRRKYSTHLDILLKMKDLDLYDELFVIIVERGYDIENIKALFHELCHIHAMAKVLLQEFDENKKDIVINTTKTFIKLMNEEIFQLYNSKHFNDALEITKISKEIEEKFENMIENNFECYIDRNILLARIRNDLEENTIALRILTELRTRLKDNLYNRSKYFIILSDLAYTYKLLNDDKHDKMQKAGEIYKVLYNEIIKHVLCLDDSNENLDVFETFKEKYTQIKSLQSYKDLLSSSEILNSKTYLRIETICEESAYINMRCGKKDPDLLNLYKDCISIYRDNYLSLKTKGKRAQSIQEIRMLASIKSVLAKLHQDFGNNSDALYYYLCALDDFNKIYFQIKQIYGENHLHLTKILYKLKTGAFYVACSFQKLLKYNLSLKIFIDLLEYEKNTINQHYKHIQALLWRIKTVCKLAKLPVPAICHEFVTTQQ